MKSPENWTTRASNAREQLANAVIVGTMAITSVAFKLHVKGDRETALTNNWLCTSAVEKNSSKCLSHEA